MRSPDRSTWGVIVSVLFALSTAIGPPFTISVALLQTLRVLSWTALLLACIAYLLAHAPQLRPLAAHRRGNSPVTLVIVAAFGATVAVVLYVLTAPLQATERTISSANQSEMVSILSGFDGQGVGIVTIANRPERIALSKQLADVYRRAKWRVIELAALDERSLNNALTPEEYGILVLKMQQDYPPSIEIPLNAAIAATRAALDAAHLDNSTIESRDLGFRLQLYQGGVDTGMPVVFIGSSVPPEPKH